MFKFFIASFIFIQSVSAQSTVSTVIEEVPAHVSIAFSGKFPQDDVKKWEKRKEGYIAHFKKGRSRLPEQDLYVIHLNSGTLLSSDKVDACKEDHVLCYTVRGSW